MAEVMAEHSMDIEEYPGTGHSQVEVGSIEAEIRFFSDLLKDAPNDAKLLRTLGNLYRHQGNDQQALLMYAEARRVDPTITGFDWCMAELGVPAHLVPAPMVEAVPNELEAVGRLLQEITQSKAPILVDDVEMAADLLNTILTSTQPAQFVAEHLDEIDALLPALIELNVRQARADGQPELADALAELRQNILVQIELRELPEEQPGLAQKTGHVKAGPRSHSAPQIFILNPDGREPSSRMILAAEALAASGCQVQFTENEEVDLTDKPDVVLVSNSHTSPVLMRQLAVYTAANVPIVHDLDLDFEEMPGNHSDYAQRGLGNLDNSRAYMASLMLARCITVPSTAMASAISQARCPVRVIPDGWSEKNSLWKKAASPRTTLNLGWAGQLGQIEDINMVRRQVNRILREYRQIQLVIAGDAAIYQLFDSLSENRKLFLPATGPEDRPYLLSQMDMIFVPLRNIPFNRAHSDQILVESGVRKVPWVASDIPAFQEWGEGGLIASTMDDWFTCLRRLASSDSLRQELGQKGYQKALLREKKYLGSAWLGAIQECLGSTPVLPAQPFLEP
jgi:glycosyltransferase involved in cell wall biosynthesis